MTYQAFNDESLGFTTRQLHAGYNPANHNMAKTVPIYQDAAFQLGDFERGQRLFGFAEEGYSYGRYSNPTTDALEKRMASLEGGSDAIAMASGMAAIANVFLNLARMGDNIVAAKTLYGGSISVLQKILPQYGVTGHFAEDVDDPATFEAAIDENTKAIFIESLSNPVNRIPDFSALADIAHAHGIPLIVDNTFATPWLLRPFEHGADIVVYSATKYLAGHGAVIAGITIEKGGFDWLNGRYPQLETFYEENKETVGAERLRNNLFGKRYRMVYLTDLGAHVSPTSAFYVLQGIETLSLRMERHVENARKLATFLASHPAVFQVSYPDLPDSPCRALAQRYFPRGAGAIVSFRLKGGLAAVRQAIEKVRIFDFMVNVGDAKSLIIHPATSTHFGQPDEVKLAAGAFEDTLRLSVGIEDAEDLIGDLAQALEGAPAT